jgi:hypothetical protein
VSLPGRQQRLLREIDKAVCRCDPRLASMLAIFARLAAGEQMPAREQLKTPASRVLAAAATIATLISRAAGACARQLRLAITAGTAAATSLVRNCLLARRRASPGTPAAGPRSSARPDQPGLPQP